MVKRSKKISIDTIADPPYQGQVISSDKPSLCTLSVEVLAKILWYLINDTHGTHDPNSDFPLDMELTHTRISYYYPINPVPFKSLMRVNKFFYEIVHKYVFETVSSSLLLYTDSNRLSVNKEKFVFCQNKMQEHFQIKPEYYLICPLTPYMLSDVKTIYMVGFDLVVEGIVGFRWLEDICETTITHLSKFVIGMDVFDDMFVDGTSGPPFNYSLLPEEAQDLFEKLPGLIDEGFPRALVKKLTKKPLESWTDGLAQYKIQFLFNTFAKFVAQQKRPVDCSIISNDNDLFQLAQFLWAFKNKKVLDRINDIKIEISVFTRSIPTFLIQMLRKMKDLKNFFIIVPYTRETSRKLVLPVVTAFAKLESLEKLEYVGPQLTTAPVLPTSLTYLSISDEFLFPLTVVLFDKWLSNIVQLDIFFTTQGSLRYLKRPL